MDEIPGKYQQTVSTMDSKWYGGISQPSAVCPKKAPLEGCSEDLLARVHKWFMKGDRSESRVSNADPGFINSIYSYGGVPLQTGSESPLKPD